MNQADLNRTEEFYGEYKPGFFASPEQVFISFSVQYVSGRGVICPTDGSKPYVTDVNYKFKDVIHVEQGVLNKKNCAVLRTTQGSDDVYLPGVTESVDEMREAFEEIRALEQQLQQQKEEATMAVETKSSDNMTQEDEMAEFERKVKELKTLYEVGILEPDEYEVLRKKLISLYQ